MTLQELLDALAAGEDLAARLASADNLPELRQAALEAFDAVYNADATYTEDDLAVLATLEQVITAVDAETARVEQASAEQAARAREIADRIRRTDAEQPTGDAETAPEAPETPEGDTGTTGPASETQGAPEPVLAAAQPPARRPRVDLGAIARRTPRPTPPAPQGTALVAAADVPGIPTGATYGSMEQVAEAALRQLASMPVTPGQPRTSRGLAVLHKQFPAELVSDGRNDDQVMEYAASESRLEGGSLLAAGGWCAPSETLYDLCERETTDGLIDLPEMVLSRGGVRWTLGPDFAAIWTGTGFFTQTEAQAIAGETKPCFEIPCPPFTECRMDAVGVCLTSGILQERGYPEVVARFIRGVLTAHAHRYSAITIQRMATASTLVSLPAAAYSATVDVLGAIELQVWDYRYRHRMSPTATLEIVAPYWLLGVIRSDVAKRNGYDDPYDVPDSEIRAWFSQRGVMVQFVYDWQDAFVAGQPNTIGAGLGGATPATAWPQTVDILLYAAGTWVRGTRDIITIETLYDSTLLSTNRYQALFTEDGLCVMQRCHDSRLLRIPLCASGASGEQVAPACATTV